MALSKLSEKCKACLKVDSCDHKKMEMCALAELPHNMCANAIQTAYANASAPILRERIESPVSPFTYRDELEKARNEAHFGSRFMTFGA